MKGFASNSRIIILAAGIIALFAMVPARLVQLHIEDTGNRGEKTSGKRRQRFNETARRGDILDSRGDTLATSRCLVQIAVDPNAYARFFRNIQTRINTTKSPREKARLAKDASDEIAKWRQIADILEIPRADLERICSTRKKPGLSERLPDKNDNITLGPNEKLNEFDWINRAGVPEDIYQKIAALKIRSGIIMERFYERAYPHNQLAAHLIGFVSKQSADPCNQHLPVNGIEAFADCYLRPANGWRETEGDAFRRELVQFRAREVPAIDGYTVKLTIDSVIQTWAEDELASLAASCNPQRAVIIISDAQSGALLALANHPTFNLNDYGKATDRQIFNFAIQDYIDPGSTFKIVAAAAALDTGLVTPSMRFDCSKDTADYKGRSLRLMADDHAWPFPLSVADIIARSSNRGAALLAMRLGDQRFYDYIRAFGFGSRTGAFDSKVEKPGAIQAPSQWSAIDITRIPAGYSIAATPLQIHCAMATIASGGELLTPQIISEVRTPDGDLAFQFTKDIRRRVISPETASTMRALLQRVVSPDGTASNIARPGYEFAGKTGTAQKLIDGRYSNSSHVASFSGFFPASAPRVVITIIADNVPPPADKTATAAYGSVVAAPSFRHLADKLIPYLNIRPLPEPPPPFPHSILATTTH